MKNIDLSIKKLLEVKSLVYAYLIHYDDDLRIKIMMIYLEDQANFDGNTLTFIGELLYSDVFSFIDLLEYQAYTLNYNLSRERKFGVFELTYIDLMRYDSNNYSDWDIFESYKNKFNEDEGWKQI